MSEEIIDTKHPVAGKKNKRISAKKYDIISKAIIDVLKVKSLTHTELVKNIEKKLNGSFPDNISWCTMIVKLDLEARGIIKRTTGRLQKYKLLINPLN